MTSNLPAETGSRRPSAHRSRTGCGLSGDDLAEIAAGALPVAIVVIDLCVNDRDRMAVRPQVPVLAGGRARP